MDDLGLAVLWHHARLRARLAFVLLRSDLAVWSDVRVFPPLALLAGLNCVACLIVMRQRSGGLPLSLTNWRLCVAATAAAGLTIGSRWLLARIERIPPAFRVRVFLAAVSVLPLIVLLTLATPRNSLGAIGYVSLLAVAAGNANLLWNRWHAAREEASTSTTDRPVASTPAVVRIVPDAVAAVLPQHPSGSEWTERSRDDHGQILLRGRLTAAFAAGQSLTTVHIPFIPPFASTPAVSCQIIDQPVVRARSPAVYRYGVRIELKRSGDVAAPLEVEVEFRATQSAAARAA